MGKTIITNYGGGVIVNESNTGSITVGQSSHNSLDYKQLTSELKALYIKYCEEEKDDIGGKNNIKNAINLSQNEDKEGLKNTIRKFFTTYMKDLAKELSLKLLVHFITEVCK